MEKKSRPSSIQRRLYRSVELELAFNCLSDRVVVVAWQWQVGSLRQAGRQARFVRARRGYTHSAEIYDDVSCFFISRPEATSRSRLPLAHPAQRNIRELRSLSAVFWRKSRVRLLFLFTCGKSIRSTDYNKFNSGEERVAEEEEEEEEEEATACNVHHVVVDTARS